MLAVQLALGSLQVKWKVRRYEVSRWVLFASMLLFAFHYILQMTRGWRAQGADVGGLFNILFYTPLLFAMNFAIINLKAPVNRLRRYCLRCVAAYGLILIVFAIGFITKQSLHMEEISMLCSPSSSSAWCIALSSTAVRRTF